jgi:hypothetical protein
MQKSPINTNPYGVYRGIAAEDKEENSTILLVIVPELMPNATSGVIGAGITDESIKLQTRDGKAISSSVTSANHIVATWDGISNSRVPPSVRKGEPVEVWRTEGQDKYRWRATGSARDFRSTDRVQIEVGAIDPKKQGVEKSDDNTYSAYLDSVNKKVGMRTSKANGEAAAFTLEADLAAGTFYISDDSEGVGNRIFLDTGTVSGKPAFQVNLTTGTTLKFDDKDVFLKVPGGFFVDIGERAVINSPLTVINTAKKGTIIVNAMSIVLNSGKDIILTAGGVIGLNSVATKIGGVLVAAAARIANAVKGPAGADYKAASISDPLKSQVKDASNTADTTMSFPPYRNP